MNVIAAAGAKTGDVGRKVGFDMSEGWGMVFAALLAAIAALLAGWLAYRAGRRQVADQGLIEHRHWRRQNRFDAYQKLMTATDEFAQAMDRWRLPSTRSSAGLDEAMNNLDTAVAWVRLAGPDTMHDQAKHVFTAAGRGYQHLRRPISNMTPIPPALWTEMVQRVIDAQNTFVREAAKVLDDPAQ
ncbi:hypothetical protein [Streptomyces asiaticus]|uniref:hypothetical protein n=1 Tax=Streptomyces asiaticus TaxID=114695 RepID=UPI001BA6B0C4|nr:hypothetical protein [Streptomyces asiaticus]